MLFKNGFVVDEHFEVKKLDVRVEGQVITEIGENLTGGDVIDLSGKYLLPGFIDTHIHGAFGVRPSDPNPDLNQMTRFEATQGVTSIALTTDTSSFPVLLSQIDRIRNFSKVSEGTKVVAIHAEGPFISLEKKGAMNPAYIQELDTEKFDEMAAHADGLLKIITIAPEKAGSEAFIQHAVNKGVIVSLGHTNATYEEAKRAIDAGASRLTHTFNAMRSLNHREPGVLGAGLENKKVTCEMICDYVHLHPSTIRLIYAAKGADNCVMISDSGHAAGITVSQFEVDGIMRYVKDGVVRLADGTIAGSAKTLKDGVQNLLRDGVPMGDVAKMASFNPAKSIGLEKQIGSIQVGKMADLVILDAAYEVVNTLINGKFI